VEEGIREEGSYELEEVGGDLMEGSAGEDNLMLAAIGCSLPRTALAEATAEDEALQLARRLAREGRQGYRVVDGIVFRDWLDVSGNVTHQICLPTTYRAKCLRLAHAKFGHQGRNKMVALIRPYFYWPKMSSECARYIKGCAECQAYDKANPPRGRAGSGGSGGSISSRYWWLQVSPHYD